MHKKITKFIRLRKYRINQNIKWHKTYFALRHRIGFIKAMSMLSFVLKTIVFVTSLCAILWYSGIILRSDSGIIEFNTGFSSEYISKSGLLSAQITLTLICVSLIALVSNIDKKHLYGESLLDLAFPSKVFTFKLAMTLLFGLLLLNVFLMLRQEIFAYVLAIFLLALYMSIIVLYRFASVFLCKHSFRNRLFYKYYRCNLVHMKKTKPIEPHLAEPLQKLKEVSLRSISQKDYVTLSENMVLYFNLLKCTLFNHPRIVEEYYTEHLDYQDLIGHINEISLKLLYSQEPVYGLQVYNNLLRHINYYKIVCVQNITFTSTYFIEALVDIGDKTQIKNYMNGLMQMCRMLFRQYCLYSIADLSYCRLAKPTNMICYFAHRDMYERIYDLITQSNKLSASENEELFESLRSSIIETIIEFPFSDVDDFRKKQRLHSEEQKFSIDIKGEPIALLFMRFFENCDYDKLNSYSSLCSPQNGKDNSATFALILSMLSVINRIHSKEQISFVQDTRIDRNTAKTVFKNCYLLNLTLKDELLNEFYEFVVSNYVATGENDYPHGTIYGFHPKFNYKIEIVDTFFAYLYQKNQTNNSVENICRQKGLVYKKSVENTILSLSILDSNKKTNE